MDGISRLSEDLGLDPATDVRVLGKSDYFITRVIKLFSLLYYYYHHHVIGLLWRLGASSKPGIVTKTEFFVGMKNLKKSNIKGNK